MNRLFLYRHPNQKKQTFGLIDLIQGEKTVYTCKSLELPWLDNQTDISCIPEGEYWVQKWESPTFGKVLRVFDVPGRTDILIHPANYVGSKNPKTGRSDLKGCIAPGKAFADLDGDGLRDIISSGPALKELLNLVDHSPIRLTIATLQNEDLAREILK